MKKEARRLVLNGTDDAYAKRDAVRDPNPDETSTPDAVAPEVRAAKRGSPESGLVVQPEQPAPKPKARSEPPQKAAHSIQVNYRLNLGPALSARLQSLADAHDQSLDLVMKGIRARAAERFRTLASAATKPPMPEPATGGKSIRYAASISGELAENLHAWFDPFGLGVAKDACKPILIWLFQEEARALCDAAEKVRSTAE